MSSKPERKNPVLTVHVKIDDISACPHMTMPDGEVLIIPFTGTVEGEIFSGKVMPGAADVQTTNPAGVRHMLAQYMMEGVDCEGQKCHIFVENNGYFERGNNPSPFEAFPTIRTDSKALRPYLHGSHFVAEGHPTEIGVDIKIFDTNKEA